MFQIIKSTLKGRKPRKTPNQDYIKISNTRKFLIITVSDGLGSSKFSREGAEIACSIAIKTIKANWGKMSPQWIGKKIIEEWQKKVKGLTGDIKDYRTTNSFLVVSKIDGKLLAGQLGDVRIDLVLDGKMIISSRSQKDFLNETECLGDSIGTEYILDEFSYNNSLRALLTTDGIGDELMEEQIEELLDYIFQKYNNIPSAERNRHLKKEVKDFIGKKNNDDKSIVFLWRN